MATVRKTLIQVRDSFAKSLGEALASFFWKTLVAMINFVVLPFFVRPFANGLGPRFQISLRLWMVLSATCLAFVVVWFFLQMKKDRLLSSNKQNAGSRNPAKLREWGAQIAKQASVPILVVILCVSLAVSSTLYAIAPEVRLRIIPKTEFDPSDIVIVAIREDQTVDRFITDGDGRATAEWIKRSQTKFLATRFVGEFVEWSEFEWDPSSNEVSSLHFPQFRHEIEQYEPILFANGSAELSRKAGEDIVTISNDLRGTEDIIALVSRTSKTPNPDPSTFDNYGLSLRRGESARAKFNPAFPLPQMVVVPLDYHFPIKGQKGEDLDAKEQRSVMVVPLRRRFETAAPSFKPTKGPEMVFRQTAGFPVQDIDNCDHSPE